MTAALRVLMLACALLAPGPGFAQGAKNGKCLVWMGDHWERPKVGAVHPPGQMKCDPEVVDHRPPVRIQDTATERKYVLVRPGAPGTPSDKTLLAKAVVDQMGVIASDYRGIEPMGSGATERLVDTKADCFRSQDDSVNGLLGSDLKNRTAVVAEEVVNILTLGVLRDGLNSLNFWYPNSRRAGHPPEEPKHFKRTAVGSVKGAKFANEPCFYLDEDLNVDVELNPPYAYLVSAGQSPELTSLTRVSGASESCERHIRNGFDKLELEIAVRQDARRVVLEAIRSTDRIGVYGAWIYDKGHCNHPEIHPAEQLFWKKGGVTTLGLFADTSRRFAYRRLMDDGTVRPWAALPVKGTFAVAFRVPDPTRLNQIQRNAYPTQVFDLESVTHHNVRDYLKTDKLWGDRAHTLYSDGVALVRFIPHSNSLKISFEKIGSSEDGSIQGFLVLETEVGSYALKKNLSSALRGELAARGIKVSPALRPRDVDPLLEMRLFEMVGGHYLFRLAQSTLGSPGFVKD